MANDSRFKKGSTPWNKGKKGLAYMVNNQFAKGHKPVNGFPKGKVPWNKGMKGLHLSPATEFQKGMKSNRILPVGTTTTRKRKDGTRRTYIKIENPSVWILVAAYNWENHFGKLIKGDIIHHINGDHTDDKIENLIALPRKDHPIFHNRWGLKEFTDEQIKFYHSRYNITKEKQDEKIND